MKGDFHCSRVAYPSWIIILKILQTGYRLKERAKFRKEV